MKKIKHHYVSAWFQKQIVDITKPAQYIKNRRVDSSIKKLNPVGPNNSKPILDKTKTAFSKRHLNTTYHLIRGINIFSNGIDDSKNYTLSDWYEDYTSEYDNDLCKRVPELIRSIDKQLGSPTIRIDITVLTDLAKQLIRQSKQISDSCEKSIISEEVLPLHEMFNFEGGAPYGKSNYVSLLRFQTIALISEKINGFGHWLVSYFQDGNLFCGDNHITQLEDKTLGIDAVMFALSSKYLVVGSSAPIDGLCLEQLALHYFRNQNELFGNDLQSWIDLENRIFNK